MGTTTALPRKPPKWRKDRERFCRRYVVKCVNKLLMIPFDPESIKTGRARVCGHPSLILRAGESCVHALRVANPIYETLPQATFRGFTDEAWLFWSRGVFREILYPALLKAHRFAASGCARELMELDAQISQLLSGAAREASLTTGRRLLLSLTVPHGERVLEKLTRRLQEDPALGCHLAVAHAARCTAFHLSPALCVASYVYQEALAAFPSAIDLEFTRRVACALDEGGRGVDSTKLQAA